MHARPFYASLLLLLLVSFLVDSGADAAVGGRKKPTTLAETEAAIRADDNVKFEDEPTTSPGKLCLWYTRPAKTWTEALPVGNGYMGAMIYGGVNTEHIQFNECTVWTGQPHDYAHKGAVKYLPEIRRLLQEGRAAEREARKLDPDLKSPLAREKMRIADARQREAEGLAMREFMSEPLHQSEYQALGDLWIEFPKVEAVSGYSCRLKLSEGVAETKYRIGDTTYFRHVYASHPDKLVVVRISTQGNGRISCCIRLTTPHKESSTKAAGNRITLNGQVERDGIRFQCIAQVEVSGPGDLRIDGDAIRVSDAQDVTIALAAATTFKNYHELGGGPAIRCKSVLDGINSESVSVTYCHHLDDYQPLFHRISLDLGRTLASDKPTNIRLRDFRNGNDPDLAALALPVRPIFAHLVQPRGRAAGQFAGHLERFAQPALGQQVHLQHQYADELLARAGDEPGRMPERRWTMRLRT